MKFKTNIITISAVAMAGASLFKAALGLTATMPGSMPTRLIGLTSNNQFASFCPKSSQVQRTRIKGGDGRVIGINVRPANRLLYGLTSTNKIYTIDPEIG